MIKTFVHKGLQAFFETGTTAGVQVKHKVKLQKLLFALNNADDVKNMDLPGYNLHQLKGSMKGLWSVKVNANWRIIFRFENGDAYVVDYLDYH